MNGFWIAYGIGALTACLVCGVASLLGAMPLAAVGFAIGTLVVIVNAAIREHRDRREWNGGP